jgi:hypothetical protein
METKTQCLRCDGRQYMEHDGDEGRCIVPCHCLNHYAYELAEAIAFGLAAQDGYSLDEIGVIRSWNG